MKSKSLLALIAIALLSSPIAAIAGMNHAIPHNAKSFMGFERKALHVETVSSLSELSKVRVSKSLHQKGVERIVK